MMPKPRRSALTVSQVCLALPALLQPGVWFPEERGALRDRRALLAMASEGSARFELNRTPWQIASDPKQLGFGIYLD